MCVTPTTTNNNTSNNCSKLHLVFDELYRKTVSCVRINNASLVKALKLAQSHCFSLDGCCSSRVKVGLQQFEQILTNPHGVDEAAIQAYFQCPQEAPGCCDLLDTGISSCGVVQVDGVAESTDNIDSTNNTDDTGDTDDTNNGDDKGNKGNKDKKNKEGGADNTENTNNNEGEDKGNQGGRGNNGDNA